MLTPAQIAKAALRRLALAQLEPTPQNYARAWAEEGGDAAAPERAAPAFERLAARVTDDPALRVDIARALANHHWDELQRALERSAEQAAQAAQAWAALLDRTVRGLERSSRQWTAARRKDSLHRLLGGSGSDLQRLQQRLRQLVHGWDSDTGAAPGASRFGDLGDEPAAEPAAPPDDAVPTAPADAPLPGTAWPALTGHLLDAVQAGLPEAPARARELADELAALAARIAEEGATMALVAAVQATCVRAQRLFAHRHHLVEQLGVLCLELTAGLTELAEDGSWAQGQMQAMQARLRGGEEDGGTIDLRGARATSELLAHTRVQQQRLRADRDRARDALKGLIQSLLQQVGELGDQTGRFSDSLGRYADTIAQADSIDSLAGVVREMVEESHAVQQLVRQTQQRLGDEHARAGELEARVRELENELRHLSDEVATDALTQVANRRGLMQAFDAERARLEREGSTLAVGLIDIDNFKKLNDTLGHGAGDEALKSLAQRVRASLRPVDHVARFGGEEFVVLLPGTAADEAQQVLTRLQRQLSAGLFMHENQEVFVTFSAGVTAYRGPEAIEQALERADEALYEAKRTGKNRTCIG